jgi:dihydroorotate dehydrogenase electron transfer subunit
VGAGTEQFASLSEGDCINILGPLGNGFPTSEGGSHCERKAITPHKSLVKNIANDSETIRSTRMYSQIETNAIQNLGSVLQPSQTRNTSHSILFGGGIGIPPMLGLAQSLMGEKIFFAGYRDAHTFLADEARGYAQTVIATDDGSVGYHGNAVACARSYYADGREDLRDFTIYACGPLGLLRAVKAFAQEHGCTAYVSLEERMACGIGACLGCVCSTTGLHEHTHAANARVCKDGPVFEVGAVAL